MVFNDIKLSEVSVENDIKFYILLNNQKEKLIILGAIYLHQSKKR
jgi:hypothetical protein